MHGRLNLFTGPWRTLGVLLAGTALLPLRAAADDSYIWTFDSKAGDTAKFRTYIKITGKTADNSGNIDLSLKSTSTQTYKEVTAEGDATYEQLDDKMDVVFNGTTVAVKPEDLKLITLVRGKNGIMLKRTNPAISLADAYRQKALLPLQSLPAPDKPVKIGDSWTTTMANPMIKGKTITATSTLVGIEKILGQDALKINLTMEFPSAFDPADNEIVHMDETYDIDVKTHELLRARYTIKNPVLPFPTGKTEANVFVTRILTGVNEKEDPEEAKLLGVEKPIK